MSKLIDKYPLTFRFLIFVLLPVAVYSIYGYYKYFIQPLPQTQRVTGLNGTVQLNRDSSGILHVRANSDYDVYFAMGYAHAQDRMWQLELQRRISKGRLSEVFGQETVQRDIWLRTLGLHHAAERDIAHLSPGALQSLEAYANGVNQWIDENHELPVEFKFVGIDKVEPWKVADSLAWGKMFALNLSGNMNHEIQRLKGVKKLPLSQLTTFYPTLQNIDVNVYETADNSLYKLFKVHKSMENKHQIGGRFVGSNAWVVSGQHTQSGYPILANDPHLGLQIPSLWYPVSQQGKELQISGFSLVGLPLVIIGKNEHISWGFTNMIADVQDLFIEQPNSSTDDSLSDVIVSSRVETIKVKQEFPSVLRPPPADIQLKIRYSENGPIINDVVGDFNNLVSLRWTALEMGDTSYESFYRLSFASDWESFKQAIEYLVAPVLNFLYADVNNNIGMIGGGKIPIRKSGVGAFPISAKAGQWLGYIPQEQMPQSYNPKSGYLLNANNEVKSGEHFISIDFVEAHRANRIEQLLQQHISKGKLTIGSMKKIQMDVLDLSAGKLLQVLSSVDGQTLQQQKAIEELKKWSQEARADSVGATLYYSWLRHLRKAIYHDELVYYWSNPQDSDFLSHLSNLVSADRIAFDIKSNSIWCNNVGTATTENCQQVVIGALESSLKEIGKLLGNDMEDWQWGNAHFAIYPHILFSRTKLADRLFDRKISSEGAEHTVNLSSNYFDKDKGYIQTFGAGFKQIISMSKNNPEHFIVNSTGQSGQISSPFYDNMMRAFHSSEYFPMTQPKQSPSDPNNDQHSGDGE